MAESLVLGGVIELLNGGPASALPQAVGAVYALGGFSAQGSNSFSPDWDLGTPVPVIDVLAELLVDGERPFGRRFSNRTIQLPVYIVAPDLNTLAGAREALFQVIDQPVFTLTWKRPGGQQITFDCFRASQTMVEYNLEMADNLASRVMLSIPALPYGRSSNLNTLTFTSSLAGQSPPPAPVTIDTFATVSSSTQPSNFSPAPVAVLGLQSAFWDWDVTNEDTAPLYTHSAGGANITGLPKLSVWVGLASPDNYSVWNKGNVVYAFTLTDNNGVTLSFGTSQYCYASNSQKNPTWQQITANIPQTSATFNYANVTSYSIQCWRLVGEDGDLEIDSDVYFNGLQAVAGTAGSPASARGTVYQLLGVLGSARTPLAIQATQVPSPAQTVTTFSTPGAITYTPPAGVTTLAVQKWGGGGAGGGRTTSGAGGGGAGGEMILQGEFPCTAGVPINGFVGAGGGVGSGTVAFVQRVGKGGTTNTSATTFSFNASNQTAVGHAMYAWIGFGANGGTVTSVADARGNSWSLVYRAPPGSTGGRALELWTATIATAVKPGDQFTVTLSTSQGLGAACIVDEWSGIGTQDNTPAFVYNSSQITNPSVSGTMGASEGVAMAACVSFGPNQSPTVSSPFTKTGGDQSEQIHSSTGCDLLAAYDLTPGAGSLAANFHEAAAHTAVSVILAFTAASAGSGNVNGQDTWFGANDGTTAHGGNGVPSNTTAGGTANSTGSVPNALTGQNANFEGGIGTWSGYSNCTVAPTSAQAHGGTGSLQMTSIASGDMVASQINPANVLTQGLACDPGDTITVNDFTRAAASARTTAAGAAFYDQFGNHISDLYGSGVADTTSSWVNPAGAVTAPASAAFTFPLIKVQATSAANEVHYADDATFYDGAEAPAAAGANGSTTGGAGGAAGTGGGGGGSGGGSGGNNPGGAGTAPGGGGGGAFSTGGTVAGGAGGNGQIAVTSMGGLTPFQTLILHIPGLNAPAALVPMLAVGSGNDVPNGGTEYAVPAAANGVNARFGGTYTVVLTNFSWSTPGSASTITVTVKQYEYPGGPSVSSSVSRTVTPNNLTFPDGNGIVTIDNITLPVRDIAPDNSSAYFTVTINDTVTGDRFLDVLFIDTDGQTVLVNSPTAYNTYWQDIPTTDADLGYLVGSTFDRSQAVGMLQYAIVSGGPLTAQPGNNNLLAYAVEGQPALSVSYFDRYWVDDPYAG